MVAKFRNRVNFSGIVNYAHNHKSDTKRARILGHQGVCIVSNETIADSFNTNLRRADKNGRVHRISQPVKHVAISFSAEDASRFPDNEEGDRFMAELVGEWLHGMGLDNAQYIIARHFDTAHPHCHLVFSRIDLDGNVISNFNEYIRSAKVCAEIKLRHGLTFGDPSGEKVNRNRLRPEQRLRFDIKVTAIRAAESSSSWDEFQRALEAEGIEAAFSFNRTTGSVRGISFSKDGVRFAGSKLSKLKLTYGKLAEKFGEVPGERIARLDRAERISLSVGFDQAERVHLKAERRVAFDEISSTSVAPSIDETREAISMIPLSAIVQLLMGGPAVTPTAGDGSTDDDDWNDERRRRQEASRNQNIFKPSKRKR